MKKLALLLISIFFIQNSISQNFNTSKLHKILNEVSDSIVSSKSQWRFKIKQTPFICIADSTHNRMRIISPIGDSSQLTEELKTASLIANFHTALDVKYAIADGVLWSVFIHPLKELSNDQVLSAISQVYYANIHFGTTFSSTSLIFPGRKPEKVTPKKKRVIKRL